MKFATTGSQELPRHLKILVTGSPKSGKTSFLGGVPGILIADTEASANNLQSVAHLNVPFASIHASDDLRQLLMLLRDDAQRQKIADDLGVPAIEAVAIDTLDAYQEILKRERLAETRQKQFKRDDWSWLLETMTATIQAFTSLPMHVIFTVHTKIQNLGSDDDPRSVVLPSLSGQMAERLAGMVGYSLATFRRDEVDPATGNPHTVYLLRTEGDEVHPTLGNRSAGRLPAIIRPEFSAVAASLPALDPAAEKPARDALTPAVTPAGVSEPAQPAAPVVAASTPVAPEPTKLQETVVDELTAAAVSHLHKLWKDVGLPKQVGFVGMTLTQAREAVVMWETLQHDFAEGKVEDPQGQMRAYLIGNGWAAEPKPEPAPAAQKAKRKPRKASAPATQTPQDAVDTVKDEMGGKVVDIRDGATQAPCDVCGKPVDDADIAALASNRFSKWLCVNDYRAAAAAQTK